MTSQPNQFNTLQIPITQRDLLRVFFIVFVFTLIESIFFRSVLLPYLLPNLHAGSGFMSGGDSIGYHDLAVQLAERIRLEGWEHWQLRPNTEEATLATPAGLASGIYAVFGPNPIFFMPLNALTHSLSCVCLYVIFLTILNNRKAALAGLIPFALFPTAIFWNSQILKDGISILGSYVYLVAWILLVRATINTYSRLIYQLTLATVGFAIIWSVRSYLVIVYTYLSLMLGISIFVFISFQNIHPKQKLAKLAQCAIFTLLLFVLGSRITHTDAGPKITDWSGQEAQHPVNTGRVIVRRDVLPQRNGKNLQNQASDGLVVLGSRTTLGDEEPKIADGKNIQDELATSRDAPLANVIKCHSWSDSPSLPSVINRFLLKIIIVRDGYFDSVYASAGTTVDREVCITNPMEFVEYLPRVVQLGLFAPFPPQWIEKATHGGVATRAIAGCEMIVVYIAILALLIFGWSYRYKLEFWILIEYSLFMVLLNAIVTPNIGSLYRMRFGYLMILVGMGVGAAFIAINRRKESQ